MLLQDESACLWIRVCGNELADSAKVASAGTGDVPGSVFGMALTRQRLSEQRFRHLVTGHTVDRHGGKVASDE